MKGISSVIAVVLVVFTSLSFSVIMYSYQQSIKARTLTTLEAVKITSTTIIVKNTGNNPATDIASEPPAKFNVTVINPGEEAKGVFNESLKGMTVLTIKSAEGNKITARYEGTI